MAKKGVEDYVNILKKLSKAGLSGSPPPNLDSDVSDMLPLKERVDKLLGIINSFDKNKIGMLFFVMYDIENDKVRRYIVKYLLKKGCFRIQRSIFLANTSNQNYEDIKRDLADVQASYDNEDSIVIVPISTDYLHSMKVIGQSIDVDIITQNKNTLFF